MSLSANKGSIVSDDKDQLSGDDTILDHIEKVNKGSRQKKILRALHILVLPLYSLQEVYNCHLYNLSLAVKLISTVTTLLEISNDLWGNLNVDTIISSDLSSLQNTCNC